MREVTPRGKVEPHDAVVGLEESRVHREVSRASRVRLDVHLGGGAKKNKKNVAQGDYRETSGSRRRHDRGTTAEMKKKKKATFKRVRDVSNVLLSCFTHQLGLSHTAITIQHDLPHYTHHNHHHHDAVAGGRLTMLRQKSGPHRPFLGVQAEKRESPVLAEGLHSVYLLVSPVVALSRLTLAIPVPAPQERWRSRWIALDVFGKLASQRVQQ